MKTDIWGQHFVTNRPWETETYTLRLLSIYGVCLIYELISSTVCQQLVATPTQSYFMSWVLKVSIWDSQNNETTNNKYDSLIFK